MQNSLFKGFGIIVDMDFLKEGYYDIEYKHISTSSFFIGVILEEKKPFSYYLLNDEPCLDNQMAYDTFIAKQIDSVMQSGWSTKSKRLEWIDKIKLQKPSLIVFLS